MTNEYNPEEGYDAPCYGCGREPCVCEELSDFHRGLETNPYTNQEAQARREEANED
jgi:hypothetical protein